MDRHLNRMPVRSTGRGIIMKKCPQCQTSYADEERFCPNCGTALVAADEPAQEVMPAAGQPVQTQQKKSKLPLILAICGVLVLGVLVGLAAAHLIGRNDSEPKQKTEAKKSDDSKKKKAVKDEQDKNDGDKDSKKEEGENFYQAEWCSFSYPEEWVGKVRIEENVYDKIRSISISYDEKTEYGNYPLLYAIELSDYAFVEDPPMSGDEYYYNPGYKETLGVSTTGVYAHLVQPTDVQFDPSQQEEYMKLYQADLTILRESFKFDY